MRRPAPIWLCFPLAALALASLTTTAGADAGKDYMLQCQGCHMADGRGSPGSVPDLRKHLGLFLTVAGGREYLIRVPGSAQSPLSNAELADVLNWMIRKFGPAEVSSRFSEFTSEEIALNRKPLVDVEPLREILLERIASRRR